MYVLDLADSVFEVMAERNTQSRKTLHHVKWARHPEKLTITEYSARTSNHISHNSPQILHEICTIITPIP